MKIRLILSWIMASALTVSFLSAGFAHSADYSSLKYAQAQSATDENGNITVDGVIYKCYDDHAEVWGHTDDLPENVTLLAETDGLPVTNIAYYAFSGCESLKSVTIPESIVNIDEYAFTNCINLTSVNFSDGLKSIGESAFWGCSSLTSIEIPNSIESINKLAFCGCINLATVSVPENLTDIGEGILRKTLWIEEKVKENPLVVLNGILIDGTTCSGDVIVPDGIIGIADGAFSICSELTSVILPDGLKSIGESAFYNCTNLKSVTIPESVEKIDYRPFYGTPWYDMKKEENPLVIINGILIDGQGCSGDIVIPDGVTSIGRYAFSGCEITSIKLPDNLKNIGEGMFSNCDKLTSIVIPEGVSDIEMNAFYACTSLESVIIPKSVTNIGDSAFLYCEKLQSINIPDSVTDIGNYVFSGCETITSMTIPDGVSRIGDSLFEYCHNLESVTLPKSIASIGFNAFERCPNFTSIYYNGTKEQWNTVKIDSSNDYKLQNVTIYYKAVTEKLVFGDVNSDSKIDASDASAILAEYSNLSTGESSSFSENQKSAGDVNSDGMIDASDASEILAFYSYLSTGGSETDMSKWILE